MLGNNEGSNPIQIGSSMESNTTQSRYTAYITPVEWRWVIVASCALVLLAFAPLLWVALRGNPSWQFMGIIHNYLDGATYLSKMGLGESGSWLVYFQHTPEIHGGAFIQVIYLILGHLSRISGVPLLVMFHTARVAAALLMYVAIYQLAAHIWVNIRARKLFFVVASTSSGLGWIFAPLTGLTEYPDLAIPEAFPLYSSFMNVHFPLTIACLALLVALFITLFRPSDNNGQSFDKAWWMASVLSLLLSFLYPQSLVPLGGALVLYAAFLLYKRRLEKRFIQWILAVGLPALPIAIYYSTVVSTNPAMVEWNRQNLTASPPIWMVAVGYGLPLLIALPGIWRALRRFESDGDRLMILWLICMLISMYLPTNIQRRFSVGMMLPIAYFATRALVDVWLPRLSRRLRPYLLVVLLPLMTVSQLLVLLLPALSVAAGSTIQGVFLQKDYVAAYEWLSSRIDQEDVILASPNASIWLPGWAGGRVVYAHHYETLNAVTKEQQVINWYTAQDVAGCRALLDEYHVRYILMGQAEMALGETVCTDQLQAVAQFGEVTIYAP